MKNDVRTTTKQWKMWVNKPKAHETLKYSMYTLEDPYPSVKGEQGYKKENAMMLMRGSKG